MAYKTLLAFHAVQDSPSTLDPVIQLARNAKAHLDVIVLGILVSPPAIAYQMAPAAEWVQYNKDMTQSAVNCASEIEQYLAAREISASVAVECDYPARLDDIAARYSFCTDVMVATQDSLKKHDSINHAFNGTFFDVGCPFLQLPESNADFEEMSRVAIAWNGRPETARAIRNALPILKNADRVNIITIDPKKLDVGEDPGSDLAAYLSRYGIDVTVDVLASGGMNVSKKLLQRTNDIDANILVMGGYGHTKLRERLLGGVTRETLQDATLPVYMVH
ncbi:MAG: universal stress protein [Rhizobiaceae bacterium]